MNDMSADLAAWLRSRTDGYARCTRLHSDVSGRRFWRVRSASGTLILMDTGKVPLWPWMDIHGLLADSGFRVPAIIECDTRRGWVLQEDLGSIRLLDVDDELYLRHLDEALEMVILMQKSLTRTVCTDSIAGRRSFTPAFLMAELENTLETLFFRLLKVPVEELHNLQDDMRQLCASIDPSTVFVHRDFHSANLMVHGGRLTMVDWQDARFGPPAYDIVSLIRDSYRDCGDGWEDRARKFVMAKGDMNLFQVVRTACQRNLKAAGTFGMHYRKTGDASYLTHIPRTMRYLADYSRICPQLSGLVDKVYRMMENHSGEIDLRDFRSSSVPSAVEG